MIRASFFIAILRLGRRALSRKAREADADGRPCCALTLAMVRADVSALIDYLTHECLKEP